MRLAAILGLAVLLTTPLASEARPEPLKIAISKHRTSPRAHPKSLVRGIRDAFRGEDVTVVGSRRFARTMRKLGVPKKERGRTVWIAEAGYELGVSYVIDVTFTKRRRGWAARTRLVRVPQGTVEHSSTTHYLRPRREARDRGRRIGKAILAHLARAAAPVVDETPIAEALPPAPPIVPEEDVGFGSGGFESAEEEAFFTEDVDASATVAIDTSDDLEIEPDAFELFGFDWTLRGHAATTYRGFFHSDLDDDKNRNFAKVGVRPTLTGRMGNSLRVRMLPRIELSVIEPRLHRAMIEEGFVEYATSDLEVRLGFDALTWGAASTVNIADVINARDFSEGFADAPKIGQPLLSTRFFIGNHSLTVLYMTPFVTPRFAPPTSPFSPYDADVIDDYGNVVFGSDMGAWHPQGAARLALSFHRVAVRASYFYGYRRTPIAHQSTNSLVFPLVHHASLEGQLLLGSTTLKLETASIWHQRTTLTDRPPIRLPNGAMAAPILLPGHRIAWVAGVEHELDDLAGTSLLLVGELFGDTDSELFTDDIPPDNSSRFFSNHAVVGFRWLFNNDRDSRLDVSDLFDITRVSDHLIRVEYSERWFERWTFAVGGQLGVAQDGTKMTTFRRLSGGFTEVRFNY